MTNAISNLDDIIDSRDVIARIEELETERGDLQAAYEDAVSEQIESMDEEAIEELKDNRDQALDALEEFDNSEEGQELTVLKALAEQGEAYAPDWKYGAQLINEDYFEEAMDEMLEDCGYIPRDLPSFLTITVDYGALKMDYTKLDFDGQTYYIR